MSLLNDALKQASRDQQRRKGGGIDGAPMRYAAYERRSKMTVALPVVSIFASMLAGWFAWQWSQARNESKLFVQGQQSLDAERHLAQRAGDAVAPGLPEPARAPSVPAPDAAPIPAMEPDAQVSTGWDTPQLAEPDGPPPQFPDLRLQGVFYRPSHPTALLSGRIVEVGDIVMGAQIKKIESQAVTLEWKGETRLLLLSP
jgi:hypothetical protein